MVSPSESHLLFHSRRLTALTQHNLSFQAQVMSRARDAIMEARFPDFLRSFFANYFGDVGYPEWCVNALRSVGVDLLQDSNAKVVTGSGAKWEYSDRKEVDNHG
jgi:hypothetical protein